VPAPVIRGLDAALLGVKASAFDRLAAGAVVLDGAGIIVDTNESWRLFTHLNDGDRRWTGLGVDYLAVCDRAAAAGALGAAQVAVGLREILSGDRLRMDFEYPCPSPTEDRWFLLQASGAPIADGTGAVVFHVDITARKLLSDRLAVIADDDELTGLPNRRSAVRYLDEQLGLARAAGGSVWVYFIGLTGFNDVNDRYGHRFGDELLCKVAIRARRELRPCDRLCRFGGDEFVLIGPGLDRAGAVAMSDRLRALMDEPFQIGDIEVLGTVAVGFAESRPDSTVDSLLEAADHEMYIDKRATSFHAAASTNLRRHRRTGFQLQAGAGAALADAGRNLVGHSRRLAVLASAQREIAALNFDARQVAVRVGEWALAVSFADAATVEVRDGDELVCQSAIGDAWIDVGSRRATEGSTAGACMASARPAMWAGVDGAGEPAADWGMQSSVSVPLVATDGAPAIGVLTVVSRRMEAFDDNDVLGLEVLAGIAAGFVGKAELLEVLERTAARYRTLVDHLPSTAVLVFDSELCLLVVAGPGARLWRYQERNISPGRFLHEIVSPAQYVTLEPFYRGAFVEPGTFDYYSADTGLDFHFAAVSIPNAEGEIDQLLVTITDVTQANADQEALREAERQYRTAFEEGPVGMSRTGLTGRFEAVNQALCDLTGYSSEKLCASEFVSITHPDDIETGAGALESMVEGIIDVYRTEKRFLHADGHDIWVALSTTIVRDADDAPLYFLSHFLDITDRKQFESQLQHLADHDPTTGLANRRSFEATLNRQVSNVARHGQAGALLVLDLDHFKQINDTLGHQAGDELIISLASVVRRRLRGTDVIGRLGGDEFAVMLPYASLEHAEHVATNLLDAVRSEVTLLAGTHRRKVTTSIGIAMFDDQNLTGAEILVNADLAMYDAKEAGRDRYAVHEAAATQPTTRARLAWVDRITDALEHNLFTLYAQPIMHLAKRKITRHELLLRMIDDDGKVINPGSFLAVAEKFGLINRVDRWVVDHAISALATYADPELSFEINLSGVSMTDKDLLVFIEQRLTESPSVQPSQLTFEVTETAAVANLGAAREFADRLTTLGCSFSLDDFGAGFGSFYYVKYLPFNDLKIDGEFITHCLSNPTDQLVINAIVTLAKGLGKRTIAEFVGDQDTLEYLAARGVDYAQGFHVGRPVPLEQAIQQHSTNTSRASDPPKTSD
jgi:diguanylate cyclase (GGDEF)-like protein/PAS domain S-box-containing protein